MDVSRRQLGAVLAGAAVAQAQVPADAELEDARARQRIATQTIARVPLPMTTEPAFQFKA
ncbi:MAG TPA: hypothetical protein VLN48_17920 [Bryobacteraceae bacterium]|nr:hypothetical protein [Bryobacteraceae bacterium]